MTERNTPSSLEEIRVLLASLPGPDEGARKQTVEREAQLTKPAGSLGRLEELSQWLAIWQGEHPPHVDRPRVCIFAGNHGVASRGVSAFPADVTAQMVKNFIDGGAAINQLCERAGAEMRVYEMALETPTQDFTQSAAMGEEDCVNAMVYGMLCVDQGADILCLGEMGIANTTSAAAVCCALFGGSGADWVGPGTGIDGEGLSRKAQVVDEGLAHHKDALGDPLEILRCLGGNELAAIAGAVIAARMAHIPVLLDGFTCTASAAVLFGENSSALDHCRVSHVSAEPGHERLLEAIGHKALLDLGMRLGEGTGAVLALDLAAAAVACHKGMATFAEAGVSGKGGE